eukprot:jgi/Chlat1/7610/Chrsp64S09153
MASAVVVLLLLLSSFASQAAAASLTYKHYLKRQHYCPQFPCIVADVIKEATRRDRIAAPGLLRAFFHDCFVRGCDASLLLDPVAGKVSCADILAQAAVEAVHRVGGPKISLRMGRLDGNVSLADDVLRFLPSPFFNTDQLIATFEAVGLGADDVVPLSGGHTFGETHCVAVRPRLDAPGGDPALTPSHAAFLEQTFPDPTCGGGNPFAPGGPAVNLDNITSDRFDGGYFKGIRNGRTAMRSDAALLEGQLKDQVLLYARDRAAFFTNFTRSLRRMSKLGVKLGEEGEIRTNCRRVN